MHASPIITSSTFSRSLLGYHSLHKYPKVYEYLMGSTPAPLNPYSHIAVSNSRDLTSSQGRKPYSISCKGSCEAFIFSSSKPLQPGRVRSCSLTVPLELLAIADSKLEKGKALSSSCPPIPLHTTSPVSVDSPSTRQGR